MPQILVAAASVFSSDSVSACCGRGQRSTRPLHSVSLCPFSLSFPPSLPSLSVKLSSDFASARTPAFCDSKRKKQMSDGVKLETNFCRAAPVLADTGLRDIRSAPDPERLCLTPSAPQPSAAFESWDWFLCLRCPATGLMPRGPHPTDGMGYMPIPRSSVRGCLCALRQAAALH
jgi:hypothetical protein